MLKQSQAYPSPPTLPRGKASEINAEALNHNVHDRDGSSVPADANAAAEDESRTRDWHPSGSNCPVLVQGGITYRARSSALPLGLRSPQAQILETDGVDQDHTIYRMPEEIDADITRTILGCLHAQDCASRQLG